MVPVDTGKKYRNYFLIDVLMRKMEKVFTKAPQGKDTELLVSCSEKYRGVPLLLATYSTTVQWKLRIYCSKCHWKKSGSCAEIEIHTIHAVKGLLFWTSTLMFCWSLNRWVFLKSGQILAGNFGELKSRYRQALRNADTETKSFAPYLNCFCSFFSLSYSWFDSGPWNSSSTAHSFLRLPQRPTWGTLAGSAG